MLNTIDGMFEVMSKIMGLGGELAQECLSIELNR
jgi:hypothetical protein